MDIKELSLSSTIVLKGEMNMQNILHIQTTNVSEILQAVTEKRDESPQFFTHSPIVVDCHEIKDDSSKVDFKSLLSGLRSLSFVPVGIRHVSSKAVNLAIQEGWCILRDAHSVNTQSGIDIESPQPVANMATQESVDSVKVVTRPVRSGQQVFSQEGSLVVLSQTGAGSEVLAAGSVHIYGGASGRVLAGVNGDRSARIFCQSLKAELIAIAGCYQLLDEMDTPLKGQAVMISLQGDSLLIEPMF